MLNIYTLIQDLRYFIVSLVTSINVTLIHVTLINGLTAFVLIYDKSVLFYSIGSD